MNFYLSGIDLRLAPSLPSMKVASAAGVLGGAVKNSLHRLWQESAGGSLIEYALLGALILTGVAVGVGALTHSVRTSLSHAAAGMTAASKSSLVAGGGIVALPDDRKRLLPSSHAPSAGAAELARIVASLEDGAAFNDSGPRLHHTVAVVDDAASRSWRIAKSWWSPSSRGGTFSAQRAISAAWTSPGHK